MTFQITLSLCIYVTETAICGLVTFHNVPHLLVTRCDEPCELRLVFQSFLYFLKSDNVL